MLHAWRHADPDVPLSAIKARTILMPCDTDTYFTVDETRLEAALMADAEVRPIISPYGHCAGAPGRFERESREIEAAASELLRQ